MDPAKGASGSGLKRAQISQEVADMKAQRANQKPIEKFRTEKDSTSVNAEMNEFLHPKEQDIFADEGSGSLLHAGSEAADSKGKSRAIENPVAPAFHKVPHKPYSQMGGDYGQEIPDFGQQVGVELLLQKEEDWKKEYAARGLQGKAAEGPRQQKQKAQDWQKEFAAQNSQTNSVKASPEPKTGFSKIMYDAAEGRLKEMGMAPTRENIVARLRAFKKISSLFVKNGVTSEDIRRCAGDKETMSLEHIRALERKYSSSNTSIFTGSTEVSYLSAMFELLPKKTHSECARLVMDYYAIKNRDDVDKIAAATKVKPAPRDSLNAQGWPLGAVLKLLDRPKM